MVFVVLADSCMTNYGFSRLLHENRWFLCLAVPGCVWLALARSGASWSWYAIIKYRYGASWCVPVVRPGSYMACPGVSQCVPVVVYGASWRVPVVTYGASRCVPLRPCSYIWRVLVRPGSYACYTENLISMNHDRV